MSDTPGAPPRKRPSKRSVLTDLATRKITPHDKDVMEAADLRLDLSATHPADIGELMFAANFQTVMSAIPTKPIKGDSYTRSSGPYTISISTLKGHRIPNGRYGRLGIMFLATTATKHKDAGFENPRIINLAPYEKFVGEFTGCRECIKHSRSGGKRGSLTVQRAQLISVLMARFSFLYGFSKLNTATLLDKSAELAFSEFRIVDSFGKGKYQTLFGESEDDDFDVNDFNPYEMTATLGEKFYNDLIKHAVPFDARSLRQLWPNCLQIDIALWSSRVAWDLENKGLAPFKYIPWESLSLQFGDTYKLLKHFKADFKEAFYVVSKLYGKGMMALADQGTRAMFTLTPGAVSVQGYGPGSLALERKMLKAEQATIAAGPSNQPDLFSESTTPRQVLTRSEYVENVKRHTMTRTELRRLESSREALVGYDPKYDPASPLYHLKKPQ